MVVSNRKFFSVHERRMVALAVRTVSMVLSVDR